LTKLDETRTIKRLSQKRTRNFFHAISIFGGGKMRDSHLSLSLLEDLGQLGHIQCVRRERRIDDACLVGACHG